MPYLQLAKKIKISKSCVFFSFNYVHFVCRNIVPTNCSINSWLNLQSLVDFADTSGVTKLLDEYRQSKICVTENVIFSQTSKPNLNPKVFPQGLNKCLLPQVIS